MTEMHEGIERLLAAWRDAIAAGDLEAMAALVTAEAEFWSPGQAPVRGREALRTSFAPFFARYAMEQEFRLDELILAEPWAFLRGLEVNRLTELETGDTTEVRQRAFSLARRDSDGTWRFHRGMTNRPPAAPAEGE